MTTHRAITVSSVSPSERCSADVDAAAPHTGTLRQLHLGTGTTDQVRPSVLSAERREISLRHVNVGTIFTSV